MTIALDARLLRRQFLQGIGRVTHELLRRIIPRHPEIRWIFFLHHTLEPPFRYGENVEPVRLFPPARHPLIELLWFEAYLPWFVRRYGIDLFYAPAGFLSTRLTIPQVMTIHDLAFLYYPRAYKWSYQWYYRRWYPVYARKAAHIVTVSEATRRDIVRHYGITPAKITVIPNAATAEFAPLTEEAQARIRQQWTQGIPYFITVGTIQPRKNLVRLFQAFDQVRQQVKEPLKLLVVGRKGWRYQEIFAAYQQMRHRQDVHFLGTVNDQTLRQLLAASVALCYPSLYEGFGLPVLEAMQSGTPVICSNRSALPEVAGDAAILIDPEDATDLQRAMVRVFRDPQLRQQLIQRGRQRARQFSWEQSAQQLEQIFLALLSD